MKKIFKKFQVKDFVFLAVLAAAMTLAGGITMPLVMHTSTFGLRNMVAAPLYALFCAIGIMKVRKPGALSVLGLFSGIPLTFMAPVMFFNNFLGAIAAELITLLIFRGYGKKSSVLFAAGIFVPLTLPISLVFSMWLNGKSFADLVTSSTSALLTSAGTIVLGFLGAFIGLKISLELQKAGKLKPYGESEDV